MDQKNIRNIAVIAHVDHGKTTLVDALLKQTHVFRENQDEMKQEQILDSNDLEREKGITILAKNTAISYNGVKINIIDTPGHADFSGEVERTLGMADGALLIIDAQEGPMPQTRFVLKKALELGLKVIVVINKIDKKFARPEEALHKTSNLFLDLAKHEDQLDFPVLYAIGRQGKVFESLPTDITAPGDIRPLLEKIISTFPAPKGDPAKPFKMLISSLDYNPHLGRILIGRIHQGVAKIGSRVVLADEPSKSFTLQSVMTSQGLDRQEVDVATTGDIIALSGIAEAKIGQTLTDPTDLEVLASAEITEPTLHIAVGPNTSPLAAKEGEFTTKRQIEERLDRELETNLSLRLEKLDSGLFKVSGRGELHLAILLETLRREGYELEVGKPEVITKIIDGIKQEPLEEVNIIVPEEHVGVVTQEIGMRQGELQHMEPTAGNEVEFVYKMPTRSTIGLRGLLLTRTKGTAVFNSQFIGYQPMGKPLSKIRQGALICSHTGQVAAYGLRAAQERGVTFVDPGEQVYEGMVIGQSSNEKDIEINATRGKELTNMRTKASDGIIKLTPAIKMSLEQLLGYLEPDELLEITPKSLRLRKKFLTDIDRRRVRRATQFESVSAISPA